MSLNVDAAREALEEMDDYARMDMGVSPIGPYAVLSHFITSVEELLQKNSVKQTPALFKPYAKT